jgi:glycyl-tRNA synthetase beta chain
MSAAAKDFLFELGTEELPPIALPQLERALAEGLRSGLEAAQLSFTHLESYAAPRRLAVLVHGLSLQQPEQRIRRKGPSVQAAFDDAGAPTRAALAFAASCGVAITALEREYEGKGEFLFHSGRKPGALSRELLPGIVSAALDALPIPKRMRWGSGTAEFVRPVHWVVMLHGEAIVESTLLDTPAGRSTRGHRFHAPAPIEISQPADYASLLRKRGYVIADFSERRALIRKRVEARAGELGGRAVMDDKLLDEVTALVEWPVIVEGRFDERFLALPREVLLSTLQAHQRYFAVEDASGALSAVFITVSNIDSREPARVREGNERVVRPRLADAAFFREQDRRQPLYAWRRGLDQVTFQAKLGSIGAKVERIERLAVQIAPLVGADIEATKRAAQLCKCDLLSAMVGEFPELQGTMGAYYALDDGEAAEVVAAIGEHYLPRGAGDALPASRSGVALALADRLDTLAGIFAIGQKPSGTKDPFALRRAAIGVLRIVLEQGHDLDLAVLIEAAVAAQPTRGVDTATDLITYLFERLRAQYTERGHGAELFEAVQATGSTRPLDLEARLQALLAFRQLPEAESLAAANKRIANILKKSAAEAAAAVDPTRLIESAEKELHHALETLAPQVEADVIAARYAQALTRLATLRPVIDAFFTDVMVNDPDAALRANRLALVTRVRALFGSVADLSQLSS